MKKNKHFVPMTAGAIALGTIIYIKRKKKKPNRLWAVNDITMTYHHPNCKLSVLTNTWFIQMNVDL